MKQLCFDLRIAVFVHDLIKLLTFSLIDRAGHECLQVQPNGGNGGFQLMRHGVNERIMLLIAPDFPHQKDGVQHDTADDDSQQQNSKEEQNALAPTQQDPADVEEKRD